MKYMRSSTLQGLRGLAVVTLALSLSLPLQAQPDPSSGADQGDTTAEPSATAEQLEQAKKYFHQGNELRKVRDYERALSFYAKSRELVPSGPNTMNAAFCLDKLGRADESLEMYEQLLTEFPDTLTDGDRTIVLPTVEKLRKQVGSIRVDANVDGTLVIEGRPRGKLPRTTPVRVMPGKRKVRVIREGYRPFEQWVEVVAGETAELEVELELLSTGRVEIPDEAVTCHGAEPADCAGAVVWVDGAMVGSVPWQGELATGAHWLVLSRGDMGTAPVQVVAVRGQVVTPKVTMAPLGLETAFEVTPHTARLRVGGVDVGTGSWRGRLPLGVHEVRAFEEGYLDHEREVRIDRGMRGKVIIELEVDEDHERWAGEQTQVGAAPVLTFVGFGLGAAGIVVGSIFGTKTMSEQAVLEERCQDRCLQDEIDDLRTDAHVSTASFIVAGAGVALGTVAMIIWLSDSDETEEQAQLTLRPHGLGGLALEGRF